MSTPTQYMSAADIAALFGVKPGTVETWRSRYADFPVADVVVGIGHDKPVMGWLPTREPELRAWEKSRPGRGAGGGRPRKRGRRSGSVRLGVQTRDIHDSHIGDRIRD
jgi:hypothetical protein